MVCATAVLPIVWFENHQFYKCFREIYQFRSSSTKIVPLSQSGSSFISKDNPAFPSINPAITPYKIPVELKLRNSNSEK
jgi:hypothetical protein